MGGLANRCNEVQGKDSITVSGKMQMVDFCLEPKTWQVEEEVANKKGDATKQFVNTKLMTRQTYTLDGISGKLEGGGGITFTEEDGIDYAPTTVQLPGGERVPFLFTVKELDAKGTLSQFGGDFTVPSYRGSSFLDPKGRGGSLGRDAAKALPAASTADEYERENVKDITPLAGSIVFNTAKVDAATGEIAGIFESIQPSDTDLGSKAPKDVKIEGLYYAVLE